MMKSNSKHFAVNQNSVSFIAFSFVFTMLLFFQTGAAQLVRHTEYQADQSLKSNARVNPSTLAMELSIPLAGYRGRAGNGLPVSFNYSSKVWQIKAFRLFENHQGTITDTRPMYGKRTAAGWTSNLGSPRIDFEPARYEGFRPNYPYQGMPYEAGLWGEAPPTDPLYYIKRIHVVMPDGGTHEMRVDDTIRDCGTMQAECAPDMTGIYLSVDGSRMRLEVSAESRTLFMPDGSRYFFGQNGYIATTLIDAHGNQMTYDISNRRWTDTLGRVISDPMPLNWENFEQTQTVGDQTASFPAIGTGTVNAILSWRYLKDPNNGESGLENISDPLRSLSNTGCNGNGNSPVYGPYLFTSPETHLARVCQPGNSTLGNWTQDAPFNPVVLTKITLANGQSYQFRYNVYGEITKIIYPIGGYERFVYGSVPALSGSENTYSQSNRGVIARYVSAKGDGTDELAWTYQASVSSQSPYKVTITAPDSTRTEQYLFREPVEPPQAYGFSNERTGRSYEDRVYSSNNQLMKRNLTKYITTGAMNGGYVGATRDLRTEKQISITFEPGSTNALAQLAETVYENPGQNGAPSDPAYFAAQNVKQSKTYHYVSISAATASDDTTDIDDAILWFSGSSPATVTEMDYLYDANYKAKNINGLVTNTKIKDASNNIKAQSQIVYDEAVYLESASISNAPNWTNPGNNYRGLATTTRNWSDVANNQFIETHASYDQFGNPRKNWDGRGNFSEIQYADNYTDGINRNGYALPTKTISYTGNNGSGTMFETFVKYDFNTGFIRYTTDINNQTSEFQYNDPLMRPTKTIAPNGQQTITEYGTPLTNGTLPAAQKFVKVKTQIDETKWKESLSWFDGLGRNIKNQLIDSNGDIFTLICYDSFGRVQKTSNPFRNNSTSTCQSNLEWTTLSYDEAGRVVSTILPDSSNIQTAYGLSTSGVIGTTASGTVSAGFCIF